VSPQRIRHVFDPVEPQVDVFPPRVGRKLFENCSDIPFSGMSGFSWYGYQLMSLGPCTACIASSRRCFPI
jgi:hypothetical protein